MKIALFLGFILFYSNYVYSQDFIRTYGNEVKMIESQPMKVFSEFPQCSEGNNEGMIIYKKTGGTGGYYGCMEVLSIYAWKVISIL